MNSFNVYGQTEKKVGGNTPVWLGTVKPVPVGVQMTGLPSDDVIPAGTAIKYNAETKTVESFAMVPSRLTGEENAYLYNDLYGDAYMENFACTSAVVMYHPEGLMIERVYPDITEEQIQQLQAKIPGVLLVRG